MHRCVSLLAPGLLAPWFWASPAQAGDLCVDIAPITTAAAKGFTPLRAEALPMAGMTDRWLPYPVPSELGECAVEEDPWGSRYRCLVQQGMSAADAKARVESLTIELKSCLPLSWELRDVPAPGDLARKVFVQPGGPPSTVVAVIARPMAGAEGQATVALQFVRQGSPAEEAASPAPAPATDELSDAELEEFRNDLAALQGGALPWNDDDDTDPYLHARLGGSWAPGLLEPAYGPADSPRDVGFTVDIQGAHVKDWNAFMLRYGRDMWTPGVEDDVYQVVRNRIELMFGANASLFPDGPFVPGLELLVGIGASWGRQADAADSLPSRMSGFGGTYQLALPLTVLAGDEKGLTLRPAIGRAPYGNGDPTHRGAQRYDYPFMTAWQAELGIYVVTR